LSSAVKSVIKELPVKPFVELLVALPELLVLLEEPVELVGGLESKRCNT
jgi:hypothetical protein